MESGSQDFEKPKHQETDEGVVRNFSVLDTAGDLTPAPDDLSPYNRYEDKEGNAFYALFQNPKMQFVVSELASLAVPVAPILLKKQMPKGGPLDFSAGVEQHSDFKENIDISNVDEFFLYIIFDDNDHYVGLNNEGGVSYDFGAAKFQNKPRSDSFFDFIKASFQDEFETYQKLKEKIADFKKQIEGEEGFNFIKAVVKKAEYTDHSAEDIQRVLLGRCDEALANL